MRMRNACGINLVMKCGMRHTSKERKRISIIQDFGIPETIVAWKSLTEGVLEFGVEVLLGVWVQQAEHGGR